MPLSRVMRAQSTGQRCAMNATSQHVHDDGFEHQQIDSARRLNPRRMGISAANLGLVKVLLFLILDIRPRPTPQEKLDCCPADPVVLKTPPRAADLPKYSSCSTISEVRFRTGLWHSTIERVFWHHL
ncbi:unnamed protein product [Toxocara canis]|uniref:Transposase n=1 Tax=Toxocara canis TaxID=6265 RepID=A0A183VCP1_TOXCA|nr:unnamed protein product [Toxocara canis]